MLAIDDSALMRKLLRAVLERDAAIEVVGAAHDPDKVVAVPGPAA